MKQKKYPQRADLSRALRATDAYCGRKAAVFNPYDRPMEVHTDTLSGGVMLTNTDVFESGRECGRLEGEQISEFPAFPDDLRIVVSLGESTGCVSIFGQLADHEETIPIYRRRLWGERKTSANQHVINELAALRNLQRGWDHAGAIPIDPRVIETAQQFVNSIPDELPIAPQVVPMTAGRLQLEWHRGNRSLEIEFESADRVHYLKWDSEEGVEEEDVLAADSRAELLELIAWFTSEGADE